MKRALIFLVPLYILLSACTRQQAVNAEIYLTALGKALNITLNTEEILYEGNTATVYYQGENKTEMLIRATANDETLRSLGRIALTAACNDESCRLLCRAFTATVPFFTDDDAETVKKQLQITDTLPQTLRVTHYETERYRYACYCTDAGCCITAECKADFPETGEKRTLTQTHCVGKDSSDAKKIL